MSDDWRLRIDVRESGIAHQLTEQLKASQLEHQLHEAFKERVVVSRDAGEVFCYADTREQAQRVQELVLSLAQRHGWQLESELRRWHPVAEEWEDPDQPLPDSDLERAAERSELLDRERGEAVEQGYPDYEVRVACPSNEAAAELADKLRADGVPTVRRWKYLLIGAVDEDGAQALAERVRADAPAGTKITVEGTLGALLETRPSNPFAIFGGLGG
jgi:chemotaxis regulatin CheY-phosphate phosphatase CheZ